ncbi:hypothetical protein P20652_0926 [Pseudoalteromonas sp. BSi20652]|nr:hypothetical protein P20652_0926 [Pseudoalteromonas sp. BSi20652]
MHYGFKSQLLTKWLRGAALLEDSVGVKITKNNETLRF